MTQGSTLRAAYFPGQVKFFIMAEGQLKIRVCLPYMAAKISLPNSEILLHKGLNPIFFQQYR